VVPPRVPATGPVTFGGYNIVFTPDKQLASAAKLTATQTWRRLGAPHSIADSGVIAQFGRLTPGPGATGLNPAIYGNRSVWAFGKRTSCGFFEPPGYTGPVPTLPPGNACVDWIFADPTTGRQVAELEADPWLVSQLESTLAPGDGP
jgi:hypothetical protein